MTDTKSEPQEPSATPSTLERLLENLKHTLAVLEGPLREDRFAAYAVCGAAKAYVDALAALPAGPETGDRERLE